MLEDELREMFAARVQTSPAAADPADRAIRRARVVNRRRQGLTGTMTVFAFAAVLGAAAAAQSVSGTPTAAEPDRITFEDLFAGAQQPVAKQEPALPTMALPLDLLVGGQLWTSDGKRIQLQQQGEVDAIARVPDGWVYSDDTAVRLLPSSADKPVTLSGRASWTVSQDGVRVAVNDHGTLTVSKLSGAGKGTQVASSPVPEAAVPVGFFGDRVVLSSASGYDYWSAGTARYSETWNAELRAVFGTAGGSAAVGVVEGTDKRLCLVDVTAIKTGLKIGARMGCSELINMEMIRRGAALSPDGRLLAIITPVGVQMIDLQRARDTAAGDPQQKVKELQVAANCPVETVVALVWSDNQTALAQIGGDAILACRTDGAKLQVTMPEDVTPGWMLIPAFGTVKK
ncbi:hypothetical protein ACFQY4_43240 [Catellatospora bangladeshensis]|uniref:Uncharacterized protein n=1 Tax=Catellatospora bangladeshensis TaxID=310355 RepID=A0A8J3JL12_9ACTN|nr:hypothetical protein [Catellatospora bangladeshensis]GIF82561.1 hypothetical protein Cba03nite_39100 [Catellatospora bangladeshensis]